jgi:protein-tyrosine-phosphatase
MANRIYNVLFLCTGNSSRSMTLGINLREIGKQSGASAPRPDVA